MGSPKTKLAHSTLSANFSRLGERFFIDFVLGAQTPGAEVDSFGLTINNDSSRVNIRHPATFGVAL